MIYSKDYQYISKRTRQIWANVWMLLTPVILFLMMEHINNPYGNLNIGLKYWIINAAVADTKQMIFVVITCHKGKHFIRSIKFLFQFF